MFTFLVYSVQDDQVMGAELANTMWNSLKGRPVLVLHFISHLNMCI